VLSTQGMPTRVPDASSHACSQVNIVISRGDVHWKGTAFLSPDLPAYCSPLVSPHQSLSKGTSVTSAGLPLAQPIIPGAYERNTLTHSQPGSMGGPAFGSLSAPIGPSSMDAATIADREMEGGGGVSQRRRSRVDLHPKAGRALTSVEQNESRSTGGSLWSQLLRLARR
jgi:hypothetical protein